MSIFFYDAKCKIVPTDVVNNDNNIICIKRNFVTERSALFRGLPFGVVGLTVGAVGPTKQKRKCNRKLKTGKRISKVSEGKGNAKKVIVDVSNKYDNTK